MIAGNIFKLIGEFFEWLFAPFDFFRLSGFDWWTANAVNWIFLAILIVLLTYWIGQTLKFKREGKEDKA